MLKAEDLSSCSSVQLHSGCCSTCNFHALDWCLACKWATAAQLCVMKKLPLQIALLNRLFCAVCSKLKHCTFCETSPAELIAKELPYAALSCWMHQNSRKQQDACPLVKFLKSAGWVERGAMQSFSLQFSPIPLSSPHPWVSILWLLVSEGLVSYHTQLSRISVYRKPIQYLWSSFVVFCVKVFSRFVLSVICNSLSVFSEVGVFSCFDPRSCTFSSLDTILWRSCWR